MQLQRQFSESFKVITSITLLNPLILVKTMQQLYDLYSQLGGITDKSLTFEQVYSQCFDKVKHKIIREQSVPITTKSKLVEATTKRSPCIFNLSPNLQPDLLPFTEWTSNAPQQQQFDIIEHKYKQYDNKIPLTQMEFVGKKSYDIKEINKKYINYYKNKSTNTNNITFPSINNREEELSSMKKLLLTWLLQKVAPTNASTKYVCVISIYYLLCNTIISDLCFAKNAISDHLLCITYINI